MCPAERAGGGVWSGDSGVGGASAWAISSSSSRSRWISASTALMAKEVVNCESPVEPAESGNGSMRTAWADPERRRAGETGETEADRGGARSACAAWTGSGVVDVAHEIAGASVRSPGGGASGSAGGPRNGAGRGSVGSASGVFDATL